MLNVFLALCFGPLLLLMGFGGRLLPTWMFVNSMQLVTHSPLLTTFMPANMHVFLTDYLGWLRLYSVELDFKLESWQHERGLYDYQLMVDDVTAY